jgi:hypothetical protein
MDENVTQLTEHLEENTLALYVLHAPEVEERRQEIASHLEHCIGCSRLLEEIEGYYSEVGELQGSEEHSLLPSLEVADRLSRKTDDARGGPLAPLKSPLLQVFVASFKAYPVRWSGAFALAAAVLLFLVPKFFATDSNPTYVRAKDEFLVALNKNGQELWRRYVRPEYESVVLKASLTSVSAVADIDGNGKNEIVLMLPHEQTLAGAYSSTRIACYNADGGDRWQFEFHPKMDFGEVTFSGEYFLEHPLVLRDFERNGQRRIAFAARHAAWWPCVVGLLDANDGKVLGEYWHPGWVKIKAKDVDGDGIEEVVAVGYNNAFKKNVLAVLDPRQIKGHAPATAEYTPNGIGSAAEKFYILLPDPDLFGLALRFPAEASYGIQEGTPLEIRTIRFLSLGKLGDRVAEVFFDFDKQMRCIEVRGGDEFVDLHRSLEKEGRIKTKLDANYFEVLRREVQYWDGEKFVKEPTMNRRYGSMK